MAWRPSKKVKSWNMRWQVWNAWNLETWKMGWFPTWADPSGSVTELPMPWTCGGGCQNHWVNWDAKSLTCTDVYHAKNPTLLKDLTLRQEQINWNPWLFGFSDQNQLCGKSHGKSVNMLTINDHVKLTKECLLPEDLAGFLPPLPRNLGRWSKVLVVNVVLTFVPSLLAYSSMAIY